MALPFPPVYTGGTGGNRLSRPSRAKICDPATATKLVVAESKADTVLFAETCPFKTTGRVKVGPNPLYIAAIPGTQRALVAVVGQSNQSGFIAVLDIASRSVIRTIPLNSPNGTLVTPNGIAVLPDGSRAYVTDHACESGPESYIYMIDLATFSVTATIPGYCFPAGMAVTPDGSQLWVTSRGDSRVDIFDTATNTPVTTLNVSLPTGIAFHPTGSRAYIADTGINVIRVFDALKYTQVASIPVGNLPHALAVTPSGRNLYVTNALSNSVSMINTNTNKVIRTYQLPSTVKHPLGLTFLAN